MVTDPLELESRKQIFEIIRLNPGLHYRELERKSGFISGTLEYHLNYLKHKDLIMSTTEKGFTRYYLKEARLSTQDKRVISFLRQELPRGIILYIIMNEDLSQKNIAEHFSVTRATMSYHLKRMEQKQLVKCEKTGRMKKYFILNPDRVVELLIIYKPSFVDVLVDSILNYWYLKNE